MSNLEPTDQVIVNLKYAKDLFYRGKILQAKTKIIESISLLESVDKQKIDDELNRLIREERI